MLIDGPSYNGVLLHHRLGFALTSLSSANENEGRFLYFKHHTIPMMINIGIPPGNYMHVIYRCGDSELDAGLSFGVYSVG